MKIHVNAGKGGVGKTLCSVSLALYLSEKKGATGIIDFDGGHSVKNTLGVTEELAPNLVHKVRKDLSVAIVENVPYVSIHDAQAKGWPLKAYLAQFPEDQGLIALPDMVGAFFGVPTDVPTLQKFTTLVVILLQFEKFGYEHVVIDVEPTAGLERLLSNAQIIARSLLNLQKQGVLSLAVLGAKWPDIKGYLQSDYIKKADKYGTHIQWASALIVSASYLVVSTPETSPVSQAFDVRRIIERFGGRVKGYVVNGIRGEAHESESIARLEQTGLKVVKIRRRPGLHADGNDKIAILRDIGKALAFD